MATNRQGKIHIVDDNVDITGENYNGKLVDFSIEDNCYVNDKFIGTTVAKKITVNILNPNNELNLEDKEIQAFAGVNNEYVPFGNFIIGKSDNVEVKEKTNFIGYDYMIKFNKKYTNRVTYPISAGNLFQDLCNQVGLQVGNVNFANSNYMILGNPFTNNEDCRTVLSNIAQLAGGFAKIGRDNKVYIITLKNMSNLLKVKDIHSMPVIQLNSLAVKNLSSVKSNTKETLDGNNYFTDFSKNNKWGEVNSLVLRLSSIEGENTSIDDQASIQANGLTEIVIADNYFLTSQAERENAIQPLWGVLKGISYLPFKTTYYGYPYLDSGDLICVVDNQENEYISYVLNHTFKFNGTFNGTLDTPALTKTQTAYKNNIDVKTKFKQTERKIDKINGEIEDIVEEQTEQGSSLTQVIQNVNSITNRVSTLEQITISDVDVEYALSTSSTIAPTSGWSSTAPQWENGKYMWQRTVITYSDNSTEVSNPTCITGAKGETGETGQTGDTGIGVREVIEQYYLSTSNTTQTGGSWKTTQDTWTSGKYIWTRNKITWTNNTITYTIPILATGINNANDTANAANTTANTANTTANTAKTTADTAKSTADSTASNLSNNYYTKVQTENKITQSADSTISEVSRTYSTKTETATAKSEAIASANGSTDTKLQEYTKTNKLGTFIEQNYEHVKVAWNQISEFIQLMAINNNATFAILDRNKKVMMTLDKTGQHFYKSDGTTIFGEMGVQKVNNQSFISFSIPTEYNTSINDGLAWGVTTKSDGEFHPILYIKDFTMPPKNSGGATGELQLDGCNLVLGAENGHIIAGGIKIVPEALGGVTFAKSDDTPLLSILKGNVISSDSIYMLDNISFYKNQNGSNSLKLQNINGQYALLTDDGTVVCTGNISSDGSISCNGDIYAIQRISTAGPMSASAFINTSKEESKKNIEKYKKSALQEVLDTDIYKFNYKNEKNTDKKHLGFVIGKNYKYSKEITAVDEDNQEIGADTYSMVSIAYKAIQEQQKMIEDLKVNNAKKDEVIADLVARIEKIEKQVK